MGLGITVLGAEGTVTVVAGGAGVLTVEILAPGLFGQGPPGPPGPPGESGMAVHDLVGEYHHESGLTSGHFLKATGEHSFGFGPHGLTYSDVGAAAVGHDHNGVYALLAHDHDDRYSQLGHTHSELHSHANKSLLDSYDQSNADLSSAVSLKHAAVTVSDGTTVDLGLNGQQITAEVIEGALHLADLGEKSYNSLTDKPTGLPPSPHELVSSSHTASGLTPGHFLKALTETTFGFSAHGLSYGDVGAAAASHGHAWAEVSKTGSNLTDLATRQHAGLTDVTTDQHHAQSHILTGGDHTATGLTPGHFLKALTETTFGFAAHGLSYSDVGAAASDHTHGQLHDRAHGLLSASDHSNVGTYLNQALLTTTRPIFAGVYLTNSLEFSHSCCSIYSCGEISIGGSEIGQGWVQFRNTGSKNYMDNADYGGTGNQDLEICGLLGAQMSTLTLNALNVHITGKLPWADVAKTGSNLTDLATRQHAGLTDVTADQHHAQSHVLAGSDHTASGLTIGHFLKATGATTFGFAAHGLTYSDVGAAPSAHNLLSASHGDTTTAAAVRGDIITAQGASPKWARLAVGATGTYLAGGTEPAWATLNQAAVAGLTTGDSPTWTAINLSSGGKTLAIFKSSDNALINSGEGGVYIGVAGTYGLVVTATVVRPNADSAVGLGAAAQYFASARADRYYANETAYLDGANAGRIGVSGTVDAFSITASNNLTFGEASNVVLGTTTGTKWGTAVGQKQAWWNAAPVAQPSGDVLTALGNLGLVASPTIAGRLVGVYVHDSGTTHTTQAATHTVVVQLIGGGGGGGGSKSNTSAAAAAGGGGSGGFAQKLFAVSPSTDYTYAIGAAGTAGDNSPGAGGAGGNTTFTVGATTVTAYGGSGGGAGATGTAVVATLGGAGAIVSVNGDLNMTGQPGQWGLRESAAAAVSGVGGGSQIGGGGQAVSITSGATAGNPGGVYGAGGSGAASVGNNAAAGGAGSKGVVVVWEFS